MFLILHSLYSYFVMSCVEKYSLMSSLLQDCVQRLPSGKQSSLSHSCWPVQTESRGRVAAQFVVFYRSFSSTLYFQTEIATIYIESTCNYIIAIRACFFCAFGEGLGNVVYNIYGSAGAELLFYDVTN